MNLIGMIFDVKFDQICRDPISDEPCKNTHHPQIPLLTTSPSPMEPSQYFFDIWTPTPKDSSCRKPHAQSFELPCIFMYHILLSLADTPFNSAHRAGLQVRSLSKGIRSP